MDIDAVLDSFFQNRGQEHPHSSMKKNGMKN